jgi:O-antigen/teichoic acid export membrane protein
VGVEVKRLEVLISSAPVVMLARVAGAGAGFLAQLVLARLLAPEEMGKFFAATSLAAVLGVIAAQGYPNIVQRFVTRYRHKQKKVLLAAFVAQVRRKTLGSALAFASLMLVVAILAPALELDARMLIAATAVCVCAATAFSVYPALAYADRRFALGLLPEIVIRPVVFLVFAVAFGMFAANLSAGTATMGYAAISAILAFAQFFAVNNTFSPHTSYVAKRLQRRWRHEAWLLLPVALFTTLFTDVVILVASPFLGPEALAPFGVALKISMLIGFMVQVTHQMVLPDLAEARQLRDSVKMTKALLRSTLLPVIVTMAALIGVVLWGDQLLRLFGPAYTSALWSLVILVGAQFIRALAGPASMLLTLHGAQRTSAAISFASAVVLLVASAVFTPHLGLLGTSLAVVFCIVAWTGLSAFMLWRLTNLRTDIFCVLWRTQRVILIDRSLGPSYLHK